MQTICWPRFSPMMRIDRAARSRVVPKTVAPRIADPRLIAPSHADREIADREIVDREIGDQEIADQEIGDQKDDRSRAGPRVAVSVVALAAATLVLGADSVAVVATVASDLAPVRGLVHPAGQCLAREVRWPVPRPAIRVTARWMSGSLGWNKSSMLF